MADQPGALEQARRDLCLSHGDLWFRYFELGGMSTALEVEAYLFGALEASAHERDLISVALNERCAERGGDHTLPYADE
ncbi:hypothetical protein BH20ACT2_BH20ACT2_02970 [soil metagenome]